MSILLNLTTEDIEAMAEAMANEMTARETRKESFMKEKGMATFQAVVEVVKKEECFDSESLLYFPEKYPISDEDFDFLFESMMNYAGDNVFYDDDNIFDHAIVVYSYGEEFIELFRMSGQGTIYQFGTMSRVSFDSFNVNKIVKFEDFERDVILAKVSVTDELEKGEDEERV